MVADEELREELRKINSNSRLSELFLSLARDLDVMEAKTPDEVPTHLCARPISDLTFVSVTDKQELTIHSVLREWL